MVGYIVNTSRRVATWVDVLAIFDILRVTGRLAIEDRGLISCRSDKFDRFCGQEPLRMCNVLMEVKA